MASLVSDRDTFPYKFRDTKNYSAEKIRERFSALKSRKPTIVSLDAPPTVKYLRGVPIGIKGLPGVPEFSLIEQFPEDYLDLNEISDFYIEPVRVRCPRGKRMTPVDVWKKHRKKVYGLSKKWYGKKDPRSLRETIYRFRGADECGTSRPVLMVDLIGIAGAKRILDSSAGWGDRLIGAMAAQKSYFACDPNSQLQPAYRAMISDFAPLNRRYSVFDGKFEDYDITEARLDTLITSPPYYDYEDYAPGRPKQWRDVSDFTDTFLVPAIRKGVSALRKGGLAFYAVNDTPTAKYMADTLRKLGNGSESPTFLGTMVYGERNRGRKFQPVFVFRNDA